jgi:hypothetical protein
MILFPNVEPNYANNNGIAANVDDLTPFLKTHNVTAGDLVQFAAAVALTVCPGAPRITFLAGRPNAKAPAPDGLVPSPAQSVRTIVARFADAGGFSAAEVVALLASHSIARADHVDPTIDAVPFDSTPFTVSCLSFPRYLLFLDLISFVSSLTLNSSSRFSLKEPDSLDQVAIVVKPCHRFLSTPATIRARCACSPTLSLPEMHQLLAHSRASSIIRT